MGYGTGSIYDFGCYLVSLVEGLVSKGYAFSSEGFNEILKSKGLWTGEFKNYIDVDNISKRYPEVFKSFQKLDTWPSNDQLNTWINGNFVVVCKVDARGIGGTGTHFVVLKGMDGNTAIIGDPWTGTIDKVTLRYSKYGNILSLRVFEIVQRQELMTALTHFNVKTEQELIEMVDRELAFLKSERETNSRLTEDIAKLNLELSEQQKSSDKKIADLTVKVEQILTSNKSLEQDQKDLIASLNGLNFSISRNDLGVLTATRTYTWSDVFTALTEVLKRKDV